MGWILNTWSDEDLKKDHDQVTLQQNYERSYKIYKTNLITVYVTELFSYPPHRMNPENVVIGTESVA